MKYGYGGMILTGEKISSRRETRHSATLSTLNLTKTRQQSDKAPELHYTDYVRKYTALRNALFQNTHRSGYDYVTRLEGRETAKFINRCRKFN
jgi:hypothetical protein